NPGLSHAPEATERAALLVEDDAGWRSLLSELLGENGYEVETSASYGQARGSLQSRRFDLAVVDLSLASSLAPESNRDGYRLLSSFQARGVTTIVVSGTAEVELIEQAYATYGVFTCLEKQGFERAAFVETLQRAQAAGRVHPDLERLTARELEVLALLAQGLTNKEIAKDLTISINTVKRHLKSIFEKLDVNTRSAASAKAIAAGFKPADGAIEG
ncbi:MAG TPA: response regulator transcription factor, partial [Anaerolineales bacterium]|nr:response regulator transcription factor [Anaerolineales bacterium]